jgi:hypothetical protein
MKHGRLKWFSAMAISVMLGGGLTAAMSTPALAENTNFLVNWASIHGHGQDALACVHGHNYAYSNSFAADYVNNCDVRVWVYAPPGLDGIQCINPNSSAPAAFAEVSKVFISENSAKC